MTPWNLRVKRSRSKKAAPCAAPALRSVNSAPLVCLMSEASSPPVPRPGDGIGFAEQPQRSPGPGGFRAAGRRAPSGRGAPASPVAGSCSDIGRDLAAELINGGADKVYLVDHPALAEFVEEPYTTALTALARLQPPEIILAGATYLGRAFIPRVAAALDTGLTTDCTAFDIDPQATCCYKLGRPLGVISWPPFSRTGLIPRWPRCVPGYEEAFAPKWSSGRDFPDSSGRTGPAVSFSLPETVSEIIGPPYP